MCEIISTRMGTKHVFLEVVDNEDWCGIKKLKREAFDFAKKFHNTDLLVEGSTWTNANTERDFNESAAATFFKDPDIVYTEEAS